MGPQGNIGESGPPGIFGIPGPPGLSVPGDNGIQLCLVANQNVMIYLQVTTGTVEKVDCGDCQVSAKVINCFQHLTKFLALHV